MAFLREKDANALKERFINLEKPIKIVNFTQELECQFCRETRNLLEEVATLSDKITLEVYNFQLDNEKAKEFLIDKIPATIVMADKDFGIRYYGIPSGYEFASLLESIELVSSDRSPLSADLLAKVKAIDKPVHIQVFVTPTCPYCPPAVVMGHALAHANENIKCDMIEATEFPHLANRYGVMGVPKIVVNENTFFEGALPESAYIEAVLGAINKPSV